MAKTKNTFFLQDPTAIRVGQSVFSMNDEATIYSNSVQSMTPSCFFFMFQSVTTCQGP